MNIDLGVKMVKLREIIRKLINISRKRWVKQECKLFFYILYESLGTKEGGKFIYRFVKEKERNIRYLDQVKIVKCEESKILF